MSKASEVSPHRTQMIVRQILIPLLLTLAIACGCGGGVDNSGCGGISYGTSNEAYAGVYAGHYTKGDFPANGEDLILNITISTASKVTGTVTETSSQRTATVSGEIIDWFNGCASDYTALQIHFTFPGETEERSLFSSRDIGQKQPWPFTARYVQGTSQIGNGNLELVKQ